MISLDETKVRRLLARCYEPMPAPMPEAISRVDEAMAAKADDDLRRAWRQRVSAAKDELVALVREAANRASG